MFASSAYYSCRFILFRKILINSTSSLNYLIKFTALAKQTEQQAEQTHNLIMSILVFIRDSYLFCDSLRVEINNVIPVVQNEYVEFLKFFICVEEIP